MGDRRQEREIRGPLFAQELNAPRSQLFNYSTMYKSAFEEIYDWFYRSYGETSRERLLELMKNAVGIQRLTQLSQPDLAKCYCEGLAYSAMGPDRIL